MSQYRMYWRTWWILCTVLLSMTIQTATVSLASAEIPPRVWSITPTSFATTADGVQFTVLFSTRVFGVDVADLWWLEATHEQP